MFSERSTGNGKIQEREGGSKDQEESTSRTVDSRSGPVRTLEGGCTQEHVAGCRCEWTLVSKSHIIQAGNDLVI